MIKRNNIVNYIVGIIGISLGCWYGWRKVREERFADTIEKYIGYMTDE